ncbi:hypothetical protein I310019A7_36830 [Lawsonibacter asaccharolyticus]
MFFIPPAILAIEDEDDRSFMENLYRSYYRLMYHEIFTVTSDPWLAEDILQNVVISLIRNLSTIKKLSTARLVNYIKTASINTSYNYLRKNRKLAVSTFTDLNYIAEILDSEEKGPELLYLQKEDAQKFMVVFHELDAKDQYLLTSRFVEGKSYSSMASDLGIQPNSVRMAVTRAKRRTFELLKQRYPDEANDSGNWIVVLLVYLKATIIHGIFDILDHFTVILTSQPFRTEPFDQFNESNHHLLFSIFYMKLTATLSNQWSKTINQCL